MLRTLIVRVSYLWAWSMWMFSPDETSTVSLWTVEPPSRNETVALVIVTTPPE